MLYPDIARALIERRQYDLDIRQRLLSTGELFRGYNPEMEEVHLSNARWLQKIMGEIGWPAQEQVGEEASQAAWLIVQHAIGVPSLMKSALALMQALENTRTIDPVNLAFLSDRIAMYESRPQLYGTQFINDDQGMLTPYALDESTDQVNQRRRQLGLNTVEERLIELTAQRSVVPVAQRTASERQAERDEYDAWRRKVGWMPV